MKIKSIIVDDEPLSQEVLERYINDHDQVELIQVCSDAMEAGEALRKNEIDLIFLDINMPRISGLQFVRSLNSPPLIIFTTAYPEFAVEGFEVDAVDYLLKPFPFERFLKAVNKVIDKINNVEINNTEENILWLKSEKKINRVDTNDILFIEAVGDYIKIKCTQGNLVVHETMQGILVKLRHNGFARIHRSYIVSLDKIKYVEGNQVIINDDSVPVGQSYKEEFMKLLKLL